MNNIEFLSKQAYFHDVTSRIAKCQKGDCVALATMNIDTGDLVTDLFLALQTASQKGADIYLAYDAYNYISFNKKIPGPLFFNTKMPNKVGKFWSRLFSSLQNLETAGVKLSLTNVPKKRFSSPFGGRSHIKYCLINDTVYIGGCNISSTRDIDIMVKITDPKLAKIIKDLAIATHKNPNMQEVIGNDKAIKINNDLDLLLDAGYKHQSLIYETAKTLITSATKNIFMTCQYFPNSTTAQLLGRAVKNRIDVKLIFNSPFKHVFPISIVHFLVKKYEQLRSPKQLFSGQLPSKTNFIHAKVLINEKQALVGSHNYVKPGVDFGTAEIALHFKTAKYNQSIIDCINKQK